MRGSSIVAAGVLVAAGCGGDDVDVVDTGPDPAPAEPVDTDLPPVTPAPTEVSTVGDTVGDDDMALEEWCIDLDTYTSSLDGVLSEVDPETAGMMVEEYQETGDVVLEEAPAAMVEPFALYRATEDEFFVLLEAAGYDLAAVPAEASQILGAPEFQAANLEISTFFDAECVPLLESP